MLENLKTLSRTGLKHSPNNRRVKLVICFLLVGAGYLLFQLAGGFPPRAWRFLFDVLTRLPDLWAAQGVGVLFPLAGLLLFSLSLLILWGAIVLGFSQNLVLLWPASRQQARSQADLAEDILILEQQAQQPSQSQPRLQSAYALPRAQIQTESYYKKAQLLEQQQSQPVPQSYQSQQQIQPLRGAVPSYQPAPLIIRPHTRYAGAQYTHLRLIPEQTESEQSLSEAPADEELLAEELEIEEEQTRPPYTRPTDVSEERTTPAHSAWNEDDDEQEATLRLVIGIGLDPGLARKDRPNEDSLFAIQGIRTTSNGPVPAGLFVVADGMGGHSNGSDASRLAVREISNVIVPALLRDESDSSRDDDDEQEFLLNLLKDGVQRANSAIHQRNSTMPRMMGTTTTTALIVDTTAYIVNVGDSRTYLYRVADGLVQITRDHSTVARLVEQGAIKPDEIYTHPQRNQIYRCLGEHPAVEMDTFVVPLQPDDILLLCSDGLWEMVRDPLIEKIVASSSHLPAQISNILVQAALNQGGADNISVIVVGVVKTTL